MLQVRGEGPVYSLRWSRGYSNAKSAIHVTSSPCPWIKLTLNRYKSTHHVARKCVSLHVSEGEVVETLRSARRRVEGIGRSAIVEWVLLLQCGALGV